MNLLLEWESAILVRVEELDKSVGLGLTDGEVSVVSEEVEDLEGGDEGVAVTIQSLEGGVWCEISNRGETLASSLEGSLSITDSNEDFLKSTFRFKSKGHVLFW